MNDIADRGTDRAGYDPITETYHVQYDWEGDDSLTARIVEAIAAIVGHEPAEPLYESVDPVELINVLRSMRELGRPTDGSVQFEHLGRVISITTDGDIWIQCRPGDHLTP